MKKLFCILLLLSPVIALTQQPWYKSAPTDFTWKVVGSEGFSGSDAQWTSLAFSPADGELYIAYEDLSNIYWAPTVKKFNGTDWETVGQEGFGDAGAQYLSFAFNPFDSLPYLSFEGIYGYTYSEATVMKFDGTSWNPVGYKGFSRSFVRYTSLAFGPGGEPYVAFQDFTLPGDTGKNAYVSVMKYDGSNWVYVGNESFSARDAEYISLAFSPSGEPYVAYTEGVYYGEATVMKFDGTNWVNVGNPGFTSGGVEYTCLAFGPGGVPYVAYSDLGNWRKATVKKFDGTNWVYVGTPGFSDNIVYQISFTFSPAGEPYVAYDDVINHRKANVMKFDGTNWVNVGPRGLSEGPAYDENIIISSSGEPYVAYRDSTNNLRATVKKFDSVYVGITKTQDLRLSLYPNPATDNITIEMSAVPAKSKLSITNLNGQELISRQISERKSVFDISDLSAGVYLVRITNDKSVEVGKIIKR